MAQLIKYTGLSIVSLFFLSACFSQTANAVIGKWQNEDKDKAIQMEIYLAKDGKYYGKIINDNKKKSKNGTIAISGLLFNENTQTYKGTMQPPDTDINLNVIVSLENTNRLKVVAKKLFMSKTMYLSRIK